MVTSQYEQNILKHDILKQQTDKQKETKGQLDA